MPGHDRDAVATTLMHEARVKSGERSSERPAEAMMDSASRKNLLDMRDPRPSRDYIYAIIVSAARVAARRVSIIILHRKSTAAATLVASSSSFILRRISI